MRADKSFDPRFGAERNFDVGITTHRNWFPCKWTCLPVFARPGHRPGHRRGEGETPRELRRTLMGVTTHSQRGDSRRRRRRVARSPLASDIHYSLRPSCPSFPASLLPSSLPSLLFSQQCSQWTASFLLRSTAREGLSSPRPPWDDRMNESTMLRRVAARENGSNLCPTRFGSVERLAISLWGESRSARARTSSSASSASAASASM